MKTNPGRKDSRHDLFKGKKGDLNRKSTHKMRTNDGIKFGKGGKTNESISS